MTVKDNISVFSEALITCFDACLFVICFSVRCACECQKFPSDAALRRSYELPEKLPSAT